MKCESWVGGMLAVVGAVAGCGGEATPAATTPTVPRAEALPVVQQYAANVAANYVAATSGATAMQSAVAAMLAGPSAETLAAARRAWVAARVPYDQTEPYRFYGGPIDGAEFGSLEGRMNAWPMDESYVDYVRGAPTSGLINHPTEFPAVTATAIIESNVRGGDTNVAAGWHAVEFLLWGQDLSATGAGDRPFTDFVTGADATAPHADRRRDYLTAVTAQLVADLTTVRDAWAQTTPSSYPAGFAVDTNVALRRILRGMGAYAGAELAGQRISVAYDTKDQENEHSCFSDDSLENYVESAVGLQNVYLGRYGALDGPGLDDLVRARDVVLDRQMREQLQACIDALRAVPAPFDQAILGADDGPGRVAVSRAVTALRLLRDLVVRVGTTLGLRLNLEG
jgi:putative iron-regulated protein